jgi:molybdopterin-containing oxidoreductase family iron-sulfur binding subunit
MKRVIEHPPEKSTGRRYWRSLEEYAQKPEFQDWLEREFPAGAQEMEMDGLSRRNFLQLMGASLALAGLGMSGCRRPEAYVIPYTKSPEWLIPGKALQFATAMPRRRGAAPLVATSYDTRPTKIDGNPLFPGSRGGSDVYSQASILDLYDPDRSRAYLQNGTVKSRGEFEAFLDELRTRFGATQGEGLAMLWESSTSPTRERLRTELLKQFPKLGWYAYEPVGAEAETEAAEAVLGGRYLAKPRWLEADVILSIGSEFLGGEEGGLEAESGFAARRKCDEPDDKMNRLYVVESRFSNTGGMADHRLRLAQRYHLAFVAALAGELGVSAATGGAALELPGVDPVWIKELAEDLKANRGKTLIVAGAGESTAVHAVVMALNEALASVVDYAPNPVPVAPGLIELTQALKGGAVRTVVIVGGNPVYNAPADLNFAEALKPAQVVRVGAYGKEADETSAVAEWVAPLTHYLEMWGDARTSDGTYVSIQPLILPLFDAISELELLAKLLGLPRPAGPELVQTTFQQIAKQSPGTAAFTRAWTTFVHDGFLAESAFAPVKAAANAAKAAGLVQVTASAANTVPVNALEVTFYPDSKVDDGRYNNNGWLQELPEPISKLTWDNAALLSPRTAKALDLKNEDVVTIEADGRRLDVAALIAPGQADNSIGLALGYGRTVVGKVGSKTGFNAYALRTTANPYFVTGAVITKTKRVYSLNSTQIHYSMEGRAIVRETTLATYQENPDFVDQMGIDPHQPGFDGKDPVYAYASAYRNPLEKFKGDPVKHPHQWGMVIDLNTCTGCNACVIACQSENNIPIVGKDQVKRGREMHWIRIDRYFASDENINGKSLEEDWGQYPEDPQMLMQPMACVHCESAPCETVCPVNATIHSEEGLNVMAYNRCIGTRYCANNCPYKVRRFNYFNFNERPVLSRNGSLVGKLFGAEQDGAYLGPFTKKGMDETLKLSKNPNVTVRIRGVMEKCTYCVQRIETAKIDQLVKAGASPDIQVRADSFQVACQQTCASGAITFGNISDPASAVSKLRGNKREYGVLAYLGVKPRTTYLARIRNVNAKMPGADKIGVSTPIGHHHGAHGPEHHTPGSEPHGPEVQGEEIHHPAPLESHGTEAKPEGAAHH